MPRPRCCRRVNFRSKIKLFKPQGVPLRNLESVQLESEELEALRLKYVEGLDQHACAKKMETSQSTFQRILSSANKKVSCALTQGKAIEITK